MKRIETRKTSLENVPKNTPKLFSHNIDVDRINHDMLKSLPGDEFNFPMESRGAMPIILALKKIKALFGKEKMKTAQIEIRMDSELIISQLNHKYKIEDTKMQLLFLQVWNLLIDFGGYNFVAIPREQNSEADKLVNQALDLKQESLL